MQTIEDNAGTARYPYGSNALLFLAGSLWFGGARELATGYSPLIGYVDPSTLVVQQAHYWDVTSTNSADEFTMIEKMYSS